MHFFCTNVLLIMSAYLFVFLSEFRMIRTTWMIRQDITHLIYNVIWFNIQNEYFLFFLIHFLFHWIEDISTKKIGVDETDGGKFIFCKLLYIGFVFLWHIANSSLLLRTFFFGSYFHNNKIKTYYCHILR